MERRRSGYLGDKDLVVVVDGGGGYLGGGGPRRRSEWGGDEVEIGARARTLCEKRRDGKPSGD